VIDVGDGPWSSPPGALMVLAITSGCVHGQSAESQQSDAEIVGA
jgi:hypothetical protein